MENGTSDTGICVATAEVRRKNLMDPITFAIGGGARIRHLWLIAPPRCQLMSHKQNTLRPETFAACRPPGPTGVAPRPRRRTQDPNQLNLQSTFYIHLFSIIISCAKNALFTFSALRERWSAIVGRCAALACDRRFKPLGLSQQ